MNLLNALTKLGLKEGEDFTLLSESTFEMLPKIRQVPQLVNHPEVLEVTEQQEVLDENGLSFDPPQFQTVVIVPYRAAYDETIYVDEVFTPDAPTEAQLQEAWEDFQLDQYEMASLVEEYLADKSALRDPENDSINISENRIFSWEYANIPAPTRAQLLALIPTFSAKKTKLDRIQAKLALGQITDKACNDAFMYIQGANVDRNLTSAQKAEMATLFAPALQAIQVKRPGQLKAYIASITPDEVLITTEMKEDLLEILKAF